MNDQIITFAEAYIQRGWGMTPIRPPVRDNPDTGKNPFWKSWQSRPIKSLDTVKKTWSKDNYNIGIITGKASGIVVLDFDEAEIFIEWSKRHPDAVNTYTVKRDNAPTGKCHLYFSIPNASQSPKATQGKGWDFQSDGRHVVAPPSEHYSGGLYEIVNNVTLLSWNDSYLERLPQKNKPLKKSANEELQKKIESGVKDGQRNNTAFDIACQLRNDGFSQAKAEEQIKLYAGNCTPPLSEKEAIGIVNSAYSQNARTNRENLPEWAFCKSEKGYILIPRGIYSLSLNPEDFLVYSYLIAKAWHHDNPPHYNKGQVNINYKKISEVLNIKINIENIMRRLRSYGLIQSERKGRKCFVTVNDYSALQHYANYTNTSHNQL